MVTGFKVADDGDRGDELTGMRTIAVLAQRLDEERIDVEMELPNVSPTPGVPTKVTIFAPDAFE